MQLRMTRLKGYYLLDHWFMTDAFEFFIFQNFLTCLLAIFFLVVKIMQHINNFLTPVMQRHIPAIRYIT